MSLCQGLLSGPGTVPHALPVGSRNPGVGPVSAPNNAQFPFTVWIMESTELQDGMGWKGPLKVM